jgi:hypothetical protein
MGLLVTAARTLPHEGILGLTRGRCRRSAMKKVARSLFLLFLFGVTVFLGGRQL